MTIIKTIFKTFSVLMVLTFPLITINQADKSLEEAVNEAYIQEGILMQKEIDSMSILKKLLIFFGITTVFAFVIYILPITAPIICSTGIAVLDGIGAIISLHPHATIYIASFSVFSLFLIAIDSAFDLTNEKTCDALLSFSNYLDSINKNVFYVKLV